MGGITPFGEAERASLNRAARTLIWGDHVTRATAPDVQRWGAIVQLYLLAVNGDNGSMQALPYEGGLLEQPWRTMQVFEALQGKFCERLHEQNEAIERRMH